MLLGPKKKTSIEKELFNTQPRSHQLPKLDEFDLDDILDEIELLGFPLQSPFSLLKERPSKVILSKHLETYLGKSIIMLGYHVTNKITRTSRGDAMCFGTFLDEEGCFIDTVHFPPVFAQFPFRGKGCYQIEGKVVEEFGFYSLEVTKLLKREYKSRDDTLKS